MKFSSRRYFFLWLINLMPPTRCMWLKRYIFSFCGVFLAKDSVICTPVRIYGGGLIILGSSTWVSSNAIFYTSASTEIEIGSNCDIGHSVTFVTGSHDVSTTKRRAGMGFEKKISIGDGVWIGACTVIHAGVCIGAGGLVGAGATVLKSFAANSFIGGVPARLIKMLSSD